MAAIIMPRPHLRLLLSRMRPLPILDRVTLTSPATTIHTAALTIGVKATMPGHRSTEPLGSARATTAAATILDIGDAGVSLNWAELSALQRHARARRPKILRLICPHRSASRDPEAGRPQ